MAGTSWPRLLIGGGLLWTLFAIHGYSIRRLRCGERLSARFLGALLVLGFAVPAAHARYEYVPETYREMFAEEIERTGMEQFAPLIAAQILHESGWREDVCSPVGACGLAQFMPRTWGQMEPQLGEDCAGKGPKDPRCAIRAQALYMRGLVRYTYASRGVTRPPSALDAYQISLANYNAGQGNVLKERRACYEVPACLSGVWIDNVEDNCLRAERYCMETKHYVGRITNSALAVYLTSGASR